MKINRDSSYLFGNKFAVGAKPNKTAFKRGAVPWNKGLNVSPSPLCARTYFQKGAPSIKFLPVGAVTVRTDKNGAHRRWVKISNRYPTWKPLSQFLWERKVGEIPHGLIVHHVDGNPLNDRIENYGLVSKADHINLHRQTLLLAKLRRKERLRQGVLIPC